MNIKSLRKLFLIHVIIIITGCTPYHKALKEEQVSQPITYAKISTESNELIFSPDIIPSAETISWVNNEILESRKTTQTCALIKQVTCKSRKGFAACDEWHKIKAAQSHANTILLVVNERRIVIADYYHCKNK